MRGLDPRIHRSSDESFARRWMAGSSPAKTSGLLLPDGQISDLAVQPRLQKYFCFRAPQITSRTLPSRAHKRGASRSSRTLGAGCDGRGSVRRAKCARTNDAFADGEVVWSWRPDAGVKLAERSADDGGKRARSPGRARRKLLKPSRRECRLMRCTCGC